MLSPRTNPGQGSGSPRYPGTFLQAFREAVAGLNWEVVRWLGPAVKCRDAEGHEHVVGLENLYRRARRAQRSDWPSVINGFLTQAIAGEEAHELPADLAAVAGQLLVRLGQPFSPRAGDASLWCQPIEGTDLVLNLVIDYPNRMIYVTEKLIADAGKPAQHWLGVGLANLMQRTPGDSLQSIHPESGLLACMIGDAYDSSRALLLETLVPSSKDYGYFVALPARDQLLVLPVTSESLAFVHLLKIIVDKHYKSLPYPISDDVYWVHHGTWRACPIRMESSKVTIESPPEFGEILEQLSPEHGTVETEEEPPPPPDGGALGDPS